MKKRVFWRSCQSMSQQHRVAVVVDPDYGEAVRPLSLSRHVWIVRSPRNNAVVEAMRAQCNEHSAETGVSTFNAGGTPEESFLSILGVVDEHHGEHSHDPPLSVIEVVGVAATDAIREQLAAVGFRQTEPDDEGFTAYRTV
jgi:hypothetical protein